MVENHNRSAQNRIWVILAFFKIWLNPFFTCYPLDGGYKGSTLRGHISGTKNFQTFSKLPLERAQNFE